MKLRGVWLGIIISCCGIFPLYASQVKELFDEVLKNVIQPMQNAMQVGESISLGAFASALDLPVPGPVKDVLNKIVIEAPTVLVDSSTYSASIIGGATFVNQSIVVKVRIAYGSKGAGAEEPDLVESAYPDLKESDEKPKQESKNSSQKGSSQQDSSQADAKKMANQRQVNLPVQQKSAITDNVSKTENTIKSWFKSASAKAKKSGPPNQSTSDTISAGLKKIGGNFNIAFEIGLPDGFKVSNIAPALGLLDILQLSRGAIVVTTGAFYDADFDRTFYPGLNILYTVGMGGPLDKVNTIIGSDLTSVTMHGVINPEIWGSMFTAELPGKINLGPVIQTSGLMLRLTLEEPIISVSILTGINVKVPDSDPLQFRVGLKYIPPSEIVLGGWMDGMWNHPFGIPFISIGNMGVQAGIDIATAVETLGILTVSSIGMRGEIGLADKIISVATSISLAASQSNLLISGKFEGGFGTQDAAAIGAFVIDQAAKVAGENLDLSSKVRAIVPNIGLKDAELYVSPTDISVAGKFYPKGVTIGGGIEVLGQTAECRVEISPKEISAFAYMSDFNLGPIHFTGAGLVKERGTDQSGPVFQFDVRRTLPYASMYMDARAEIDVLGGLYGDVHVDFSLKGVEFWLKTKIFDQFMSNITFSAASFLKPTDWYVICSLEQEGLDNFAKLLEQGAQAIMESAQRDIQKAKDGVKTAQQALDKIGQERENIQGQNTQNVDSAIDVMRKKVDDLKREKDALENQIRDCKGEAPKEAADEIDRRAQVAQQINSAQMIEDAGKKLAQEGYAANDIKEIQQNMWANVGSEILKSKRTELATIKQTNPQMYYKLFSTQQNDPTPAGREKDVEKTVQMLVSQGLPQAFVMPVTEKMWIKEAQDLMNEFEQKNKASWKDKNVYWQEMVKHRKEIELQRGIPGSPVENKMRVDALVNYMKDIRKQVGLNPYPDLSDTQANNFMSMMTGNLQRELEAQSTKK